MPTAAACSVHGDWKMLESGDAVTYQIVGDDEADIKLGKISVSSPIARALIGKYAGDMAEVQAPGGVRQYEVLDVSTMIEADHGRAGSRFCVVFWVGGLWAIGYLAAPACFPAWRTVSWPAIWRASCSTDRLGRHRSPAYPADLPPRAGRISGAEAGFLLDRGADAGADGGPAFRHPAHHAGLKDQAMPEAVMQSVFRDRFAAGMAFPASSI